MGGRPRHMKAGDEADTPRAQTGGGHATRIAAGHGRWRFLRHSLEMVAAMLVGMVVLGAALRGVLALAGPARIVAAPTLSPVQPSQAG
jgi:hypothetical protein